MSNQPANILKSLVTCWNRLDNNIKLTETSGPEAEYLVVRLMNKRGELWTEVFHKHSHEPCFLSYHSTHAEHIKKNIPFRTLREATRYSSNYEAYKREKAYITISLLLNGYTI